MFNDKENVQEVKSDFNFKPDAKFDLNNLEIMSIWMVIYASSSRGLYHLCIPEKDIAQRSPVLIKEHL